MKYLAPNINDISELANELGFDMSARDIERMRAHLDGFTAGYTFLDQSGDEYPPYAPRERPWTEPAAGENPLGAWFVRTSIRSGASGPLSGKRVAVKDNLCLGGVPMANGTDLLGDFVPEFDAEVVRRVLAAGAEITGKSVCEYLCLSGGSGTAASGPVQNPCKAGYSTGGSSSGSAALVAAREVELGLGTDQGGSVRIPASWSGICGMKATAGVVPYTGGMPMEHSIDHIGPLTESVADNALALEVLAGKYLDDDPVLHSRDYRAQLGDAARGLRIGIVREGFGHAAADADVDDCVRGALARLQNAGAACREVSIPAHHWGLGVWGAVVTDGFWRTFNLGGVGYNYEGLYSGRLMEQLRGWRTRSRSMPDNAKMLLLLGRYLERYNGWYYARGKNMVRRLRAAYDAAFTDFDLLAMPTTPRKPRPNPDPGSPGAGDEVIAQAMGNTLNAGQFNATGHPAMSVPCGQREGLPVGLMLIGPRHAEALIYRAAHAFESLGDWRRA
jgi:amidase